MFFFNEFYREKKSQNVEQVGRSERTCALGSILVNKKVHFRENVAVLCALQRSATKYVAAVWTTLRY